jgi:hypothetical protein
MTNPITGGCHCGKVRYCISVAPYVQQFCYCTDCTKIGGVDGYAGYVIDASGLEVTQGETKTYTLTSDRGNLIHRHFCGTCGTRIFAVVDGPSRVAAVAAGTFDDISMYKPTRNNMPESAPPWARYSDCLHDSKKPQ